MEIMISFTGIRDPYSDVISEDHQFVVREERETKGPILQALTKNKPNHLHLFYTDSKAIYQSGYTEPMKDLTEYTASVIQEKHPEIKIFIHCVDGSDDNSPVNYDFLISKLPDEYRKKVYDCYDQNDVKYKFLISPGTTQIQTANIILKSRGDIEGELVSVIDPNYKQKSGPVESIDVNFYREKIILDQNISLLNRYQYQKLHESFSEEMSPDSEKKGWYKILSDIFEAYALQKASKQVKGTNQYSIAKGTLNKCIKKIELENTKSDLFKDLKTDWINLLKDQISTLELLEEDYKQTIRQKADYNNVYSESFLIDLFYSVNRNFENESYITALSIFWRTYESFLRFVLRNKHDFDFDRNNFLNVLKKIGINKKEYRKGNVKGQAYNSINSYEEILKEYNKDLYDYLTGIGIIQKNKSKSKTNKDLSITGHGFQTVPENVARGSFDQLKTLFNYFFKEEIVKAYPFGIRNKETYLKVFDVLINKNK